MKNVKNILAILLIVSVSVLITELVPEESNIPKVISLVILALFLFHFAIRKSLFFRGYFLSPFSILSAKYSSSTHYDIPINLMFDKTIEVLDSTKFKLVRADKDRFEIFATSPISWQSWGENLYIDFKEEDGQTIMNFHSVAVMQMHTWDKNRKNSEHLINTIEESLII